MRRERGRDGGRQGECENDEQGRRMRLRMKRRGDGG